MLFDKCKNSKQQGNIGHSAALLYYSSLGWNVSNPITDCTDYDFLAENEGQIYKIQVKTTRFITDSGSYCASLTTNGGNRSEYWEKELSKDLDYVFILTECGICYSIPVSELGTNKSITLGPKYDQYKVMQINNPNNDLIKEASLKVEEKINKEPKYFCIECGKPVSKKGGLCRSCSSKKSAIRKVEERPSAEELVSLIKEHGMLGTGKLYGVSDKSISKWLVDYNLPSCKSALQKEGYFD